MSEEQTERLFQVAGSEGDGENYEIQEVIKFPYGSGKEIDGVTINEKCRSLAKKIKEIIDIKSSFADWLNNQIVRDQLKFDIKVCLIKNGYPPQYPD